jgi:hypothetical protein
MADSFPGWSKSSNLFSETQIEIHFGAGIKNQIV